MCASYGLGGGPPESRRGPFGFDPLDTREGRATLERWMLESEGTASITGKHAVNLNPVILGDAAGRRLELGWWWLWLTGEGPADFPAFNSRLDRIARTWRAPFQRRALLPASWFVEKKVRFELPGSELFGIAAITSVVTDARTGEPRLSYSMVTRDAVGAVSQAHTRMPLLLPVEAHDEWLDPGRVGDTDLAAAAQVASEEISRDLEPIVPASQEGAPPA